MIISMIAGVIIGMIASALTNREDQMGCFGNMFIGLLGAWLGQALFGDWGPQMAGMAVVPSILGAVILLILFVSRKRF
ncbi:GlsB/YeaQ/YmgE family stress response membrane protein [Streptococcus caprae]|uniref:GlsB/YeaQ/YmgE family stress response membrane protein n=1 Tax=Streptococcus caprae TaxID=1640501 RepID=A0ABV8CUI0_9STRE